MNEKAIEAAAKALCELDIRHKRQHDTDAEKLEEMLPSSIECNWRDYTPIARAAIEAYENALLVRCRHEPYQGRCAHCDVPFINGLPSSPEWAGQ